MRPIPVTTRSWLVLAVVGAVVASGALVAGQALRPGRSAGAPVVSSTPASTHQASRAGTVPASSPAAPSASPSDSPSASVPVVKAAVPPANPDPSSQAPVRLTIRSLMIDAPVDAVGVDARGAMQLPADVRRVGWYRFSPPPGASAGSVVLAGHVDNAAQGTGALFRLQSIGVGARVVVTGSDGQAHAYRVTGRQMFIKTRLPVDQLFSTGGSPRLLIITCGGPFNQELHSYRDNLVVAAEPVAS